MKIFILLFTFFSIGCSSIDRDMNKMEFGWQTMHLIDVAQKYGGSTQECFDNADPFGQYMLGDDHDKQRVLYWGLTYSVLHYVAGDWVDRHMPDKSTLIRSVDLGIKAEKLISNKRNCKDSSEIVNFNIIKF